MATLFAIPPELRAQIWHNLLPGTRHIMVSHHVKHPPVPVVFHICNESRSEAGRQYSLTPTGIYANSSELSQWIDFSRDIICVGSQEALTCRLKDPATTGFRNLQRLAFEFCPPQNFMQLLEILIFLDKHSFAMPDLKEVILYSLPKKWFEDHTGRVQERHPPITGEKESMQILLRLLHMLFGGHAWLDSESGIPPPLRWEFVTNDDADVWAGPYSDARRHAYVFRCASTGKFEIQSLDQKQLEQLSRTNSADPKVHQLVGCYSGCPEHDR